MKRDKPDDSLIFRRITRQDLPQVKNLHLELFPVRYSSNFFLNLLNPNIYSLVAVTSSDEIVGVVTVRVLENDDVWDFFVSCCGVLEQPRIAYISTIGVTKSCRKQGLASELLENAMKYVAEHWNSTIVALHVKSDNEAAINFYHKHGFTTKEIIKNHYEIDSIHYDALYMEKKISQETARWAPVVTIFTSLHQSLFGIRAVSPIHLV